MLILSDVHLGNGSASDLFGDKDALLLSVLARELETADVLLINGDAIDHLQGRSNERIERSHPRIFDALRAAARVRPVFYVLGNHERSSELEPAFPEFEFVDSLALGEELCIAHGHQFDLNWCAGESPALVYLHNFLETLFGQPVRQPFRDYDNRLNRVVHRLFFFYTQALRFEGLLWNVLGRSEKYEHWRKVDNFWARGQWGDLSCIFEMATAWLASSSPYRTLLVGHSHQPGVVSLGDRTYINAGSWALDQATYARIDGGQAKVFDAVNGHELRDERYHMLVDGHALPDMAGWFRRYYRGYFRYDIDAIRRDFPAAP